MIKISVFNTLIITTLLLSAGKYTLNVLFLIARITNQTFKTSTFVQEK